jgi:hypothetical protein
VVNFAWESNPAGRSAGCNEPDDGRGGLGSGLLFHGATNVDDVVGDDAEPDPAAHSEVALVSAAVEAMSPLDGADASFTSGAPFLAAAEPPLSLFALAFKTLG